MNVHTELQSRDGIYIKHMISFGIFAQLGMLPQSIE